MKILLAIGDSWTQGVGGVPKYIFTELGGRVDISDADDRYTRILKYEHMNSWVAKLGKKLPEYVTYNLGVRGYGNRAAVKSLYMSDIDWGKVGGGVLFFLLSGRDRYDVISKEYTTSRRKFYTLYPQTTNSNYSWWLNNIHSDHFAVQETLLNIIEAQTFASAHGLHFFFGYGFDNCDDMQFYDNYNLVEKINWNANITKDTTFFDILADLQETPKDYQYYMTMPHPSEYITNCVHPTIKGYEIISDYIFKGIYNHV